MGGGQIQLSSARTASDAYLTSNPQLTFFKSLFRRYSNFAKESIPLIPLQTPKFGASFDIILPHSGDLVQEIYLEITLPTPPADYTWIYGIGNALIKKVTLSIGGTLIDTHYGEWLNIWEELTCPAGQRAALDEMVGINDGTDPTVTAGIMYVPLKFWFNSGSGGALPLVALANSEIRLHFELRDNTYLMYNIDDELYTSSYTGDLAIAIYADYIYLSDAERTIFINQPLNYMINTLSYGGEVAIRGSSSAMPTRISRTRLDNTSSCVREIIWTLRRSDVTTNGINPYFNYSNGGTHVYTSSKLVFDGHDVISDKLPEYYLITMKYGHNAAIPRYTTSYNQFIYSYSFAENPYDVNSIGYCNMAAINKSELYITYPLALSADYILNIYMVTTKILHIENGLAILT